MSLAAEDHVVHVAMTDVVFFLHCTIPFSFSLTRLLYARANEKLYEKGQQRIKKRLADFYTQEIITGNWMDKSEMSMMILKSVE